MDENLFREIESMHQFLYVVQTWFCEFTLLTASKSHVREIHDRQDVYYACYFANKFANDTKIVSEGKGLIKVSR